MSQLIMPTGFPRWIFHRKTPLEVNGMTDAGLQASVVGLYEKAIHVSALEDVEMITVFFYPYAIPMIMGIPFNHTEACATFWNEYIERMVKPVYMEGMNLYPIHSGQWLKVYFEGGLRAFQEEFARFIRQWLPLHPAYKWADNASCLEWYKGTDVNSPDYPCGILMPIKK